MALIFQDLFTDTSGTLLSSHTPNTGTSWTKLINVGVGDFSISSNTLSVNSAGYADAEGAIYTANATYPGADYEAHATYTTTDNADDTHLLLVRIQDSNNMYALRFNTEVFQLHKKVTGTWSSIGANLGTTGLTTNDVVKIQIVGSGLKTFINATQQHSVTDTSISAAGKAGVGAGAAGPINTDDCSAGRLDTFEVNTAVEAASFIPRIMMYVN